MVDGGEEWVGWGRDMETLMATPGDGEREARMGVAVGTGVVTGTGTGAVTDVTTAAVPGMETIGRRFN